MEHGSSSIDDGDSMSNQKYLSAAQLLDWEAEHSAGRFVSYREMAETLFDKDQLYLVNLKGEDAIDEMRRIVYALRPLLRSEFKRDLILGKSSARATRKGNEFAQRVYRDAERLGARIDGVCEGAREARLQGADNAERLAQIEEFALNAKAELGRIGLACRPHAIAA